MIKLHRVLIVIFACLAPKSTELIELICLNDVICRHEATQYNIKITHIFDNYVDAQNYIKYKGLKLKISGMKIVIIVFKNYLYFSAMENITQMASILHLRKLIGIYYDGL